MTPETGIRNALDNLAVPVLRSNAFARSSHGHRSVQHRRLPVVTRMLRRAGEIDAFPDADAALPGLAGMIDDRPVFIHITTAAPKKGRDPTQSQIGKYQAALGQQYCSSPAPASSPKTCR